VVAWKLTIRAGPKVERERFAELDEALDAIERRARALSDNAPEKAVDLKYKKFEPVQQVAARLEIAGPERMLPSVRAGIDVRGDGSTEAYVGRVRRAVIEQRKKETSYDALRRVLTAGENAAEAAKK
jgi:hypothetical protein